MSLVSRRVFRRIGGKSRLLQIGSRQIGTSFDDVVREPRRAAQRAAWRCVRLRGVRNPDRFNRDGDGSSSEFRRLACETRW